jgi:DNA-binding NarL/FixJ family response regulator
VKEWIMFEGLLPRNIRPFLPTVSEGTGLSEDSLSESDRVQGLWDAAGEILIHFGGDPSSSSRTGTAAEEFFSRVQARFNPLVGQAGFRALLEEAHRRVMETHPVLEQFAVESHGNPFFGGLGTSLSEAEPRDVWNSLKALTGEFLRLAQGMGREGELILREGGGGRVRAAEAGANSGGSGGGRSTERRDRQPPLEGMEGRSREKREEEDKKRNAHPWKILVLDRDRATCEAMAQALDRAPDFTVVDIAVTVEEIQDKVQTEGIDFIIASAHLPTEEVLEVCRWLRKEHTGEFPHVVVTGLPPDDAVILRFLEAGAAAFTMEEFSVEGLRLTIRLLARGESVFPLRLQHLMSLRLSELAELVRDRGLNPDMLSELTKREGEVLLLLEEALTNREIARRLYISEGTVKSHVHQILRKLNVRDRNEAVRVLRLQRAAPGKLVLGKTGFRKEQ